MAVPIINTTQSVLGYLQWQTWEFQPGALNTPTSWTASPLPPGLALNASTGKLSGAATMPGVYVVALRASNADGTSAPVLFSIGIEATSPTAGSDIDATIDLLTRRVTLSRPPPLTGSVTVAAVETTAQIDKAQALCAAKEGDDLVFRLRFVKGGAPVDMPLTELVFRLKEFEPDGVLLASDGFATVGSGADKTYRVHAKLIGTALIGALANYEKDDSTQFPALCEFTWTATNPDTGTFGPTTLAGSSLTFLVIVARPQRPL